jgi:hypothetical protein
MAYQIIRTIAPFKRQGHTLIQIIQAVPAHRPLIRR